MRRRARVAVVPAALAAALALAATPAGAKEISALTLCGAGGHCHPVRGHGVRQAFMDGGSFLTSSPARRAPFFSVVATITEPGQHGIVGSFTVRWVPSAGRIRSTGEFDRPIWTRPDAATTRALRRAAAGLRPKPAARLGALYVPPPKAKVTEVVNPPAPARARADGGGDSTVILVTSGGVLAAALAAGAVARRRRRPARGASAPRLG